MLQPLRDPFRSLLTASVSGVHRPCRLNEHGFALGPRRSLVFDAFRNDEQFALLYGDIMAPKVDYHLPIENDKHFIGVFVAMPHELPLKLHQFEVIVVHLSNDPRRPVLGKA